MYRAGIEGIIGLSRAGDVLSLDPCLPAQWPGVIVTVRHGDTTLRIEVDNTAKAGRGIVRVEVDGAHRVHDGGPFQARMAGGAMAVRLVLGITD